MSLLVILSLLGWLYLAVFHGAFWRPLVAGVVPDPAAWPSVDIIVPARNEAASLPQSLPTLLAQDYAGAWRVVLVDDHSEDGTADVARGLAAKLGRADRLTVMAAPELPVGWVGKVAAMQAGVAQSRADYILFTDADIAHDAGSLRRLVARAVARNLDLTSLMVKLNCVSVAEKLLIPAFVFFFGMLYPFRRANDPDSRVAAAAGGVMLVRRRALDNAGGLAAIRSALIDDCSLAKIIKRGGGDFSANGRIELTLAETVKSLRPYPVLADVWHMVARSAYTQLNHSVLWLVGAVLGLGLLFFMPIVALLGGNLFAAAAGMMAWVVMSLLYAPMISFYGLPWYWVLTLPFVSALYIGATADSARRHAIGKGGQWRGREAASQMRLAEVIMREDKNVLKKLAD